MNRRQQHAEENKEMKIVYGRHRYGNNIANKVHINRDGEYHTKTQK